jgi:PAS domain S-box-containing protein
MQHLTTTDVLPVTYDLLLVVLSVAIAVMASYTALDLSGRAGSAAGRWRMAWLFAAAVATGAGIWTMHFIGMLAFRLPMAVHYDLALTATSLVLPMAVTGGALALVMESRPSRARIAAGGLLMGSGIVTMHYLGMAAMEMGAAIRYDTSLVAASVAIAIVTSTAALSLASGRDKVSGRLGSASILGVGIAGMHYTGMAAATFTLMPDHAEMTVAGLTAGALSVRVASVAGAVMLTAVVAAQIDRWHARSSETRTRRQLEAETARAAAEIGLRERRYQEIFDQAAVGIERVALDSGRILEANGRLCALLERTGEYLVGADVRDLTHPDDVAAEQAAMDNLRQGVVGNCTIEKRYLRTDGSSFWARVTSSIARGEDGRPAYRIGIVEDIDAAKQAQLALSSLSEVLREREERLRLALHASASGTWDWDLATGMQHWSERARVILGITAGASPQKTLLASVHPDDRALLQEQLQNALEPAGDGGFDSEFRVTGNDGKVRWVVCLGRALFDGNGPRRQAMRFIGMCLDVTDRKLTEERLRRSLEEKEALIREIHHRVRNNLQAIWGMVEFERVRLRGNAQAQERLGAVAQRVSLLGRILDKVYDAEALDHIDLKANLEHLATALREEHCAGGRITLSVEVDSLTSDLDTVVPLSMLAAELVANALTHGFPEGRQGCVRLSLRRLDDNVELVVIDDGVGCMEALRNAPGTGMALAGALARQLGAKLSFENGGGCRVSVLIPANVFARAA